ncbi:MAG: class I SAM-dependent methyltransferase [Geodermatophilaceae bacterium]|nr:class I SAM-dependent methyltransferase [Geodermatophilaceae bacterium]
MPEPFPPAGDGSTTAGGEYAARLQRLELSRWKRLLDVQRPYRWNLRRLKLGRVLDVGCGIGRNLVNLEGSGVGVDHNAESVAVARSRGLTAWTTAEFADSPDAVEAGYDALLLAHVMEHVDADVAEAILRDYLPYLRPGGRVVFMTPQEVGYRSDSTHVRFVDAAELRRHSEAVGLKVVRSYSFPFPRPVGRVFRHNEFVVAAAR